jgi:uncharacterized membrane protein
MLWLITSLLSALSQSTGDLLSKRSLKKLNEYTITFSWSIFSGLFLSPLLLFTGIPKLDYTFWISIIILGCLLSTGRILYMRAIMLSPLSLTIPMLAFTPLFLLVTSPLILGEFPNFFGLTGILLIVFGAYTLSIKDLKKSYLAPFKALFKEKGSQIMLLVAFIFSIAANFFKIGIQQSNAVVLPLVNNAFIALLLLPVIIKKSKKPLGKIRVNLKVLITIGLLNAMMGVFSTIAMELAIVPYVISVRRTTIIFSTLYGFLFFKEKRIIERITGAIIMVLGVIIISLFS